MSFGSLLSLDQLGKHHNTDKASGSHNYLWWYETFLGSRRQAPLTIVEIGVGSGASLRMWRDYFPYAHVVGLDIDESKKEYEGDRVLISIGNQADETALLRLLDVAPFPDVINDDGGHDPAAQLLSLRYLVPWLRPGGLYILEDIGGQNVSEFLARLACHVVHANWDQDEDPWVRAQAPRIETVNFYRESVVLKCRE